MGSCPDSDIDLRKSYRGMSSFFINVASFDWQDTLEKVLLLR